MAQTFFKGEIYYIYPRDTVGNEQMGGRPGIIVSNDMANEFSNIVEVVFLTTKEKKPLPTHVEINSSKVRSTALCEQIETVSKERIGNYINSVTQNELKEIEKALLVSLGINSNLNGTKKLEAWEKLIQEWEKDEKPMEEVIPVQVPTNIPTVAEKVNMEDEPLYVRVCAERDIYKELYMGLLAEKIN